MARIWLYRWLSSNRSAFIGAQVVTPVLAIGSGHIVTNGAQLGYFPSPYAYDGCIHLEARGGARIEIGGGSIVNNGCVFIAEGPGIWLGRDVLVGPRVTVVDSDFHSLEPSARKSGLPAMSRVEIHDNVFIGMGCMILKGVTIGMNSVVGSNSVVSRDVPPNVIAAGNPCRVIRPIGSETEEEST